MLTDADLDRIAKNHVAGRHSAECAAARLFALEDPAGLYFSVSNLHGHEFDLIPGDPGFFVYRHDGTIRQFDLGDFVSSHRKPPGDPADQRLVQAVLRTMVREWKKPD